MNVDKENNHFQNLESAIGFLHSNKGVRSQKLDKKKLKDAVEFVFSFSVANGLPSNIITTLCDKFVFDETAYDIPSRRKLLYSCVPQSTDFPYRILPLAISCSALPKISSTWQHSILVWFSGLLDYRIIDESNKYVHICYSSLFNMLDNLRLCGIICKILYQITRLEDVTPYRTKILLKLERKIGFSVCVSQLIRIYKFFRPDLIVSRLDVVGRFPTFPKWFQESLQNAKIRFEEREERVPYVQDLWPTFGGQKKRLNPFHEASAIPQPDILPYTKNIEEKKERKISVLQYKRIKDMIKELHFWKYWKWPNGAPCLLWKPVMIPLFKPHDPYVKVCVSNWLELALRTEVIEQVGNPSKSRQEDLLDACFFLAKQSETLVPVVFHFLVEFLTKWDTFSHMGKVLNLLEFFPFVSPTIFFETIFEKISLILTTASLPLFCAFINSFASLNATWALQAQTERSHYMNANAWPWDVTDTSPLEGIYYLTQRLGRIIVAGLIRFGPHSMLLNTSISYYNKVNMCAETLQLPLFVVPPVELLFAILTSADVVATHRIGLLMSRLSDKVRFVKEFKDTKDVGTLDEKTMCVIVLSAVDGINFSLMTYLDTTISSSGFNSKWDETLSCYVGDSFYKELKSIKNIQFFGVVCRALPYLPISSVYQQPRDFPKNKEKRHTAINEIVVKLKKLNLVGLGRCAKTYINT